MTKRKKFSELNATEKYKRLKRHGIELKVGKWMSILSPFITIGIVNFDEYFTEYNGVKMSMGCILALIVGGIAIYNETKKETDGKISSIAGWGIAFALAYLLNSILQDLVLILGCGLIGQIVGSGADVLATNKLEKANLYKEALINSESYKEEKE